MPEVGYEPEVQALLDEGWVLRCGLCRRRLATEHAPKVHRVYADLSGRCHSGISEETLTSFFADPFESRQPIIARALREAEAEMSTLAAMDSKDYLHKFGMQDAAEILRERAEDIEQAKP